MLDSRKISAITSLSSRAMTYQNYTEYEWNRVFFYFHIIIWKVQQSRGLFCCFLQISIALGIFPWTTYISAGLRQIVLH